MYPFSEEELEELYGRAALRDQRLADILLIDAWTGLRWSELRAVRVRDFIEVPLPVWWCSRPSLKAYTSRARSRGDPDGFRWPIACSPRTVIYRWPRSRRPPLRHYLRAPAARHRIQANTGLGHHRRGPTHS